MKLFHGTCARHEAAIKREGLAGQDGRKLFATTSERVAAGYAVRAVCLAMWEADTCDQPEMAPEGLLVGLSLGRAQLVPDRSCEGSYYLPDRVLPAKLRIRRFDVRPWLPEREEIEEYARSMLKAQELEDLYGGVRFDAARCG